MTAQAWHPTKATFMPFSCYWATLIKIFKNTYLLAGEMLQVPQKLYKRKSFASLESILGRKFQREDAFFSIIGDEVTDKYANQEILSVCLRFLGPNNDVSPKIKEVFFDYVNLDKTTGESMANAILSSLAENNIDVAFARGQAYNCASAMSSEACGVQGRIRRIAPMALYTHCNSHVLNLSVAAACRLPKSET